MSRYHPPGAFRIGPLMVWTNGRSERLDPAVSAHWRDKRIIWVRFGRNGFRLFDERNQGQHNIPIRWHYYLGGRISVKWGDS